MVNQQRFAKVRVPYLWGTSDPYSGWSKVSFIRLDEVIKGKKLSHEQPSSNTTFDRNSKVFIEIDGMLARYEDGKRVAITNWNKDGYLDLHLTEITDAGLEELKGLNSLQELGLNNTQVSDTQITDAESVHLKGLTSLRDLFLSRTQITDAGLAEIKAALPKCRVSK